MQLLIALLQIFLALFCSARASVVFLTQEHLIKHCGLTTESPNAKRLFDPTTSEGQDFDAKFTLDQFIDIDDVEEILLLSGIFYVEWNVTCWSKSLYDLVNVTSGGSPTGVTIFAKKWEELFYPRLRLRNAILDSGMVENFNIYMQLQSKLVKSPDELQITVRWWRYGRFSSSCPLNLEKFPFDNQLCRLEMISHSSFVTVKHSQLDIGYLGSNVTTENSDWDVINGSTRIIKAVGDKPNQIIYEFLLKRRPNYFVLNFMCPCILLVVLEMVALFLPPNLADRPIYMVTVVLALIFLGGSVLQQCPSVPQHIFLVSYISQMAVLCSVMCGESLLICCFTLRFSKYIIKINRYRIGVEKLIDFVTFSLCLIYFMNLNIQAIVFALKQ